MQGFHLSCVILLFAVCEAMDASLTKTKDDQLYGELPVPLLPGSEEGGCHHNHKFQESSSSQSNVLSDAEALQKGDCIVGEKSIISSTIAKDTCENPVYGECIVANISE